MTVAEPRLPLLVLIDWQLDWLLESIEEFCPKVNKGLIHLRVFAMCEEDDETEKEGGKETNPRAQEGGKGRCRRRHDHQQQLQHRQSNVH